jgi:hypothetical protein
MKLRNEVVAAALCAAAASASTVDAGAAGATLPAAAAGRCGGSHYVRTPVQGDITDAAGKKGGYFFYTEHDAKPGAWMCIGDVKEFVHYTMRATKTWRVHVGSLLVAQKAFTLGPGYYYWTFHIDARYWEPSRVCIGATNTPGYSCGPTWDYLS